MSIADSGPPTCPASAWATVSMRWRRPRLAIASSSAMLGGGRAPAMRAAPVTGRAPSSREQRLEVLAVRARDILGIVRAGVLLQHEPAVVAAAERAPRRPRGTCAMPSPSGGKMNALSAVPKLQRLGLRAGEHLAVDVLEMDVPDPVAVRRRASRGCCRRRRPGARCPGTSRPWPGSVSSRRRAVSAGVST